MKWLALSASLVIRKEWWVGEAKARGKFCGNWVFMRNTSGVTSRVALFLTDSEWGNGKL